MLQNELCTPFGLPHWPTKTILSVSEEALGLVVVGEDHRIESMNATAKMLFVDPLGTMVGSLITDHIDAHAPPAAMLREGYSERILLKVDGGVFAASIRLQSCHGHGKVMAIQPIQAGAYPDIDCLTGLPGREGSLRLCDMLIKQHQGRVALLCLDVDCFRAINDGLGHQVGDIVLKRIVSRLNNLLPIGAHLGRISGDEFLVLVPGVDTSHDLESLVGAILASTKTEIEVGHRHIHYTLSVGVSVAKDGGGSAQEYLRMAALATGKAKQKRNACVFFSADLLEQADQRTILTLALRQALAVDELSLEFQPQYGMHDKRNLIGAEALMRWSHNGRPISPAIFIPLAEENGFILKLGEWALRQACTSIKQWQADGLSLVPIAVNVSARQVHAGFGRTVLAILDEYDVPTRLIQVEITESVLLDDLPSAEVFIKTLADAGVHVSIDDFGTGYSSLVYLKRFPFATLKIDRSFVKDLPTSENDYAIASAIIAMASHLGLSTLAEGVETQEQFACLAHMGCNAVQGYYTGKPVPEPHFRLLLSMLGHPLGDQPA